jgi:hypothetical protein
MLLPALSGVFGDAPDAIRVAEQQASRESVVDLTHERITRKKDRNCPQTL